MNHGKYNRPDTTIPDDAVQIDDERHEVTVYGKFKQLTPKEFTLLVTLTKAHGRVLSRETLQLAVWGPTYEGIDTRTVDQHVARLRRKLGPEGSRITTVPNFGYQVRR